MTPLRASTRVSILAVVFALACAAATMVLAAPAATPADEVTPATAPTETSSVAPVLAPASALQSETAVPASPALGSGDEPIVFQSSGYSCLDCDTNADCDRLCGARGYSGGWCLRDLDLACSIDIDDKICTCL